MKTTRNIRVGDWVMWGSRTSSKLSLIDVVISVYTNTVMTSFGHIIHPTEILEVRKAKRGKK